MSSNDRLPRSKASNVQSMLRFQNMTDRCVELIWINFDGVPVKYKVCTMHTNEITLTEKLRLCIVCFDL